MNTRRSFLAGAAAPALWARPSLAWQSASEGFQLGVASYSMRSLPRAQAIEVMKQLNTPYINIKEFHLRYTSTPEEIAAARKEFDDAGLKILGGGNISLADNDEAKLRKMFEYSKLAGFPLIVCAPTHQTVGTVEKLVKEFNIKAAIHNHGPEDKHFPTPQSVLAVVKNMDPRMGLCIDIGHTARTGVDVVESIREAGSRLLDIHVKDLKNMRESRSQCAVGDGLMPMAAIFKELRKMNYQGGVMLEYEIEAANPAPGMIKSFAYMRGVLAGLRG